MNYEFLSLEGSYVARYSIRNFAAHEVRGKRVADLDVDNDCSAIEEATRILYAAQLYRTAPVRFDITKEPGTKIATLFMGRDGKVSLSFA